MRGRGRLSRPPWGASPVCLPTEQLPYLKCPLHTVLKLTPVAYGKATLRS